MDDVELLTREEDAKSVEKLVLTGDVNVVVLVLATAPVVVVVVERVFVNEGEPETVVRVELNGIVSVVGVVLAELVVEADAVTVLVLVTVVDIRGSRTMPASHHSAGDVRVNGKFVGEDTPETEYSASE